MAKPKKAKPAKWVRTGGGIGDDSMEEMERFNREGQGVSESEEAVGNMPNEGVTLSQLPGRLR